ncbi:hypothetical protein J7L13_02200 [bacterium]|nr:hypothetical protein [bacterium]
MERLQQEECIFFAYAVIKVASSPCYCAVLVEYDPGQKKALFSQQDLEGPFKPHYYLYEENKVFLWQKQVECFRRILSLFEEGSADKSLSQRFSFLLLQPLDESLPFLPT